MLVNGLVQQAVIVVPTIITWWWRHVKRSGQGVFYGIYAESCTSADVQSHIGRRQGCKPKRKRKAMLRNPASDPISESGREETKHSSSHEFGETQGSAAEALGEKNATRDLTDLSAGFPAKPAVAGGSESSLLV